MRLNLDAAAMVFLFLFSSVALSAESDIVSVRGIGLGEEVIVAINARTDAGAACIEKLPAHHWAVRSVDVLGRVHVGNLRSGCVLTVIAFSRKRAMLLETLSGWGDQQGEIQTVEMKPPIEVPIVLWITHDDLESLARRQMETAMNLYESNMVGIRFVPTYRNVSADKDKVLRIDMAVEPRPGTEGSICSRVDLLKGHAYEPRTLNVYYLKREHLNRNCAIRETPVNVPIEKTVKVDGNITYLGHEDILNNLAHELGHALGLRPIQPHGWGHPPLGPTTTGFTPENIMDGAGGSIRRYFSLGQVFRMNTQIDRWGGTMLIENGLSPGPGRACDLAGVSTHLCPPLNLGLRIENPPKRLRRSRVSGTR
jgi:hypothetical protein